MELTLIVTSEKYALNLPYKEDKMFFKGFILTPPFKIANKAKFGVNK